MPRSIPEDKIPVLPGQIISGDELVSFGVFDDGVVVHYIGRDTCLLFSWDEVMAYCIDFVNRGLKKLPEPVAIQKPTERG